MSSPYHLAGAFMNQQFGYKASSRTQALPLFAAAFMLLGLSGCYTQLSTVGYYDEYDRDLDYVEVEEYGDSVAVTRYYYEDDYHADDDYYNPRQYRGYFSRFYDSHWYDPFYWNDPWFSGYRVSLGWGWNAFDPFYAGWHSPFGFGFGHGFGRYGFGHGFGFSPFGFGYGFGYSPFGFNRGFYAGYYGNRFFGNGFYGGFRNGGAFVSGNYAPRGSTFGRNVVTGNRSRTGTVAGTGTRSSMSSSGTRSGVRGDRTRGIVRGSGRSAGVTRSCLLYTSPSPRDRTRSRMPSSA